MRFCLCVPVRASVGATELFEVYFANQNTRKCVSDVILVLCFDVGSFCKSTVIIIRRK